MKFRLVSAIWGADFVDAFVRLTLPTLLAPGNLPALCERHSVVYTIYTTKEDAERIQATPVFHKVAALVPVHISLFSTTEIDPNHFGSHDDLWQRGVDLARRNREILFFVIPDILYSDGTFARWAHRFEEGYKAVYSPGPQVVLETIYDEVDADFADAANGITIDAGRLREMLFRHLHPIPIMMDRNSPYRIGHAEYDVRPVSGRGMVVRVLASHPFCIEPAFFGSLQAHNPNDHLDHIAFEPVSVLSAEPLFKHMSWYYRPDSLGEPELTQLGFWWRSFGPPACVRESAQIYDFVLEDDEVWQRERARARAEGVFFRAQLGAAATAATLFLDLAGRRLSNAARFLAAALMAARLRRLITLRGDETLLVPVDTAFGGSDGVWVWSLLAPGKTGEAVRLLRDHIVFTGTDGRTCTLNGRLLDELDSEATVAGDPFFIAGMRAVPVTRILRSNIESALPQRVRAINAKRRALRHRPPAFTSMRTDAAFRPPQSKKKVGFVQHMLPEAPRPSLRARLRAAVRERGKRLVWRALEQNRNSIRRVFLLLASLPGLRGPATISQRTLDYAYRHGLRATITRVGGEFRGSRAMNLGPNRDAAVLTDTAIPLYDTSALAMSEMPPIVAEATRQASGAGAAAPVASKVNERSPQEDAAIADALRDVRLLRGLEAMASVLDRYEKDVLARKLASAPAALVRKLKNGLAGGEKTAPPVERLLRSVLARQPDCAEAALELGYLMRDEGRREEAMRAFETAIKGTRFAAAEVDARALAAAELAALLAADGELRAAADNYALSLSLSKPQSIVHLRYGEVLRQLGQIDAAGEQFAMAMNASHLMWPFPKAGRDARKIALRSSLDTVPA